MYPGSYFCNYWMCLVSANFTFPEKGDLFEDVEFLELGEEEASKVIENYRTEARKKGPPPEKRFRGA